ncbi:MAG: O-antigen/teichoic acid export membrane protein [Cryomorphaceae bacterium]
MGNLLKKIKKKLGKGDFSEVLRGGSIAFIYRIITMGISYLLMIFISRELGEEGIGIYNLSLAILGVLIMIGCLGFNTSVIRFVSQYNAKGWLSSIRSLYSSIIRVILPLALLLGVILFFLAPYLAQVVYEDPKLELPFRIVAFTLPFGILATVNVEFIRGLKKVHISELFRNLSLQIVTLLGLALAWFYGLEDEYPILFYGVGFFISMSFTSAFVYRFLKRSKRDPQVDEPKFVLKSHLLISLPMILTSFIQLINGKVDTLMIGIFETTAIVGIFSVAFKLSVITNFAIGALKTIAMPKISELFWEEKMTELNQVIQKSTQMIFAFAGPVSLVLLIFPEFILGLIKEEFIAGATTLRIFALTQLINAASGMVAVFLNMTGNQVFFTKLVAVSTTLNIVLNWFLIPRYGMEGAAWASMFSIVLWNIIGAIFIYRKYAIMTFFNPLSLLKR